MYAYIYVNVLCVDIYICLYLYMTDDDMYFVASYNSHNNSCKKKNNYTYNRHNTNAPSNRSSISISQTGICVHT